MTTMYSSDSNIYFSLWSKYRPVILQLMRASATGAQEYQLSGHEFKALGERTKSYFFSLETAKGNASNFVTGSTAARDLLTVLQQSKTGALLMSEVSFLLRLDKQFVFHVSRTPVEPAAATATDN